jgi:hypothetical protein
VNGCATQSGCFGAAGKKQVSRLAVASLGLLEMTSFYTDAYYGANAGVLNFQKLIPESAAGWVFSSR